MSQKNSKIPAWMVTYADLMTLLLCFFVLLLSFAEIDAEKFRRIAGELSKAFGVQRDIPAEQIPMGTSAVFDQFSPATPDRTLLEQIRQRTMEESPQLESLRNILDARLQQQVRAVAQQVEDLLKDSIEEGVTQVEVDRQRVVIRIQEKGTFVSGSASVTNEFEALLLDMSEVFKGLPGTIAIDGHTDNIPISTRRFQSNWDLSAMRAASVANVLLLNEELSPERLVVQGFADTQPRASNATGQGRARNRRVEITIDLSEATEERGVRSVEQFSTPETSPPQLGAEESLRQAVEPLPISPTETSAEPSTANEALFDETVEEVNERFNPLFPD
ncbi:flagellar motor protein MotB [Vreelandella rituensis]|uniref:Type VI secretion system protein TssL n=1 Tax=Vreelandella rituensis TaxID=2282306 RepID=A0A368U718_9GAMM|nr:flagellar motor protein MotB [Halomonas rituensis]RCV92958.1 type VI secretion system protein TssL [Halomonas rituensis]